MTHPDEQTLLLLAYGEAPEADACDIEAHLASCPSCRSRLGDIDCGRVLADLALGRRAPGRRRVLRSFTAALAAAATVAGIALFRGGESAPHDALVLSPRRWSVPAGYFAGGSELMAVDSILSRLEWEVSHADR